MCWGSWHGPHTTDAPLREIAPVILQIRAGAFSLEAANPRHEHEYHVRELDVFPDVILVLVARIRPGTRDGARAPEHHVGEVPHALGGGASGESASLELTACGHVGPHPHRGLTPSQTPLRGRP